MILGVCFRPFHCIFRLTVEGLLQPPPREEIDTRLRRPRGQFSPSRPQQESYSPISQRINFPSAI